MLEGGGDRFLASGSAFDDADGLAELLRVNALFEALDFVGAGGQDDVRDEIAGGETAETVDEDGGSIKFEELLGCVPAHAGAHACGGEYGGDSAHCYGSARKHLPRNSKRMSVPQS